MRTTNIMRALMAVAVVLAGAGIALGSSITSIGVLTPGTGSTAESALNAVSGDGAYAVGYSNGVAQYEDMFGNPQQFVGQLPILWYNGTLYQLPLTADGFGFYRPNHTFATGVLIRPTAGYIGIGGGFLQTTDPFKNQMVYYEAPLTNLAGGMWKDNTLAMSIAGIIGPYNTARMRTTVAGEQWFVVGDRSGSDRDYIQGLGGAPGLDHRNGGPDCASNSINGAGHTAGSDTGNPNGARRALYMNSNNGTTQTVIPQPAGVVSSEAFGISPSHENVILSGNVVTNSSNQAFVWKPGDAAMTLLGTLAGDSQSTAITVNFIGGHFITAGFSSNGTTEKAVIWDTTGIWDSTGEAKLASDLLSAAGVDMSEWSSLSRITSMSDDGKTMVGYGVWAADGTKRGFVAKMVQTTKVVARNVFYNNSYYDNNNPGIDATTGGKTDSAAIDTSKSPLMTGGGTCTFANWTGYNKGINGLIYDVELAAGQPDPQASDFTFTNLGKNGTGSTAVVPAASSLIELQGSGPRKVRMVFTFADGSVKNCWLQVSIGVNFGLSAVETHYWGNAVGDTGTGNTSPNLTVTPADELAARSHTNSALNPSLVTDPYDIDKSHLVGPADQLIIRSNNTTALNCVKYITR